MLSRRAFLVSGHLTRSLFAKRRNLPILDQNRPKKFVDRLVISPRALAIGKRMTRGRDREPVPLFRLTMREARTRFHSELAPARSWGFEAGSPGPTIDVRQGSPVYVQWVNALPKKHLFTIDHSLHGAGLDVPDVRTVVHVHGLRVPPGDDGYPENWIAGGSSVTNYYPNDQDAATLLYHDHAMSITRLNMYAGLFGFYLIRDEAEDSLQLPSGDYEIPIMIYDRILTVDGQLHYPVSSDPDRPWVEDVEGNVILANGRLYPYLELEPRAYRLRLANVSNGRFLNLRLTPGTQSWQIGSDQGLLSRPVSVACITLAPGERADIVVDFSTSRGRTVILSSDEDEIVQFRVSYRGASKPFVPASRLSSVTRMHEKEAMKTRLLALYGDEGSGENMSPSMPMRLNNLSWTDPVTETPALNSVEIWSLINLTDESHPIHLHLVRFQILDRWRFSVFDYLDDGRLLFTGDPHPPDENEAGWKDTVRAEPEMVTRIIVRFDGYLGRYVWHCHVLEHEDNEMMRPYDIMPA